MQIDFNRTEKTTLKEILIQVKIEIKVFERNKLKLNYFYPYGYYKYQNTIIKYKF